MSVKQILISIAGIIFISANPQFLMGQSTTQGLNLNFDVFGGTYISDPLGVQMANRQFPYAGTIDKDSYTLGPNDLMSIKVVASQSMFIRGIVVNASGDITLPSIGVVTVAGLTISEAESAISQAASDFVKETNIEITLESPRPAHIQVTGAVPYPGTYIVPAMSTVDQAVYSSLTNGSRELSKTLSNSSDFLRSAEYSIRNIIIERKGDTLKADLLSWFRMGDSTANPIVKDGDLITIKRLNRETPKVSISGAVKADYEFEFVQGDTPLTLLQIGGGFEEVADRSKLMVYRRTESGVKKIDIPKGEWDSFLLQPNDRVVAPFDKRKNTSASAWVYGEVQIPGNFPIISGETTALELMELTGGLTENALPHAAYLMRPGNFVNEISNKFNADLMKRTSDQLIQGLEYLEAETKISQKKVFIDLEDEEQLSRLEIFDGDRLYIPRDEHTVFVFGQVNNPGYFPYNANFTVRDYISNAGGFALPADKERVFIIKAGNATWYRPGETELESGDRIFIDRQPIEELNAKRGYEIQQQQLKNQRTQLIMTAITTITGIITTYVAIKRN